MGDMNYIISAKNYDPVFCTPYENKYKDGYHPVTLTEAYRVPSEAKINIWQSIIRFCGGRMKLSDKNQELALKTCVEGILTGNYLTTTGKSPQEDINTLKKLNKNLRKV